MTAKLPQLLTLRARETLLAASVHLIDADPAPETRLADPQVSGNLANRVALDL